MGKRAWIAGIVIVLLLIGGWALMRGKTIIPETPDSRESPPIPPATGNQQTAPTTSESSVTGAATDEELYSSSDSSTDDGVTLSDESVVDAP